MTVTFPVISLHSAHLTRTCSSLSTRLSPYPRLFKPVKHLSQVTFHCRNFGETASTPLGLPSSIPKLVKEETRIYVFRHPVLVALRNDTDTSTHSVNNSGAASHATHKAFEHLGDRVVGLVVSETIWSMYPRIDNGSFTRIFSVVVSNATLALVSLRCGLLDMARAAYGIDPSHALPERPVHWQADVLEAYIGGLYYEQGQVTAQVKKWVKHLLSPHITEAHAALLKPKFFTPNTIEDTPVITTKQASPATSPVRTSPKRPTSHTQQLDEVVHRVVQAVQDVVQPRKKKQKATSADLQKLLDRLPNKGKSVHWSTVLVNFEQKQFWVAVIRVNSVVLGGGVGRSLKAAKNAAARQGLETNMSL